MVSEPPSPLLPEVPNLTKIEMLDVVGSYCNVLWEVSVGCLGLFCSYASYSWLVRWKVPSISSWMWTPTYYMLRFNHITWLTWTCGDDMILCGGLMKVRPSCIPYRVPQEASQARRRSWLDVCLDVRATPKFWNQFTVVFVLVFLLGGWLLFQNMWIWLNMCLV